MQEPEVVVVAVFTAKPGSEQMVEEALRAISPPTHHEAGCVRYALHRATNDRCKLVLVEKWISQAALDAHFQTAHLRSLSALEGSLAEPIQVLFLDALDTGDAVKGVI